MAPTKGLITPSEAPEVPKTQKRVTVYANITSSVLIDFEITEWVSSFFNIKLYNGTTTVPSGSEIFIGYRKKTTSPPSGTGTSTSRKTKSNSEELNGIIRPSSWRKIWLPTNNGKPLATAPDELANHPVIKRGRKLSYFEVLLPKIMTIDCINVWVDTFLKNKPKFFYTEARKVTVGGVASTDLGSLTKIETKTLTAAIGG